MPTNNNRFINMKKHTSFNPPLNGTRGLEALDITLPLVTCPKDYQKSVDLCFYYERMRVNKGVIEYVNKRRYL
ncbi:hypothetical protein BsubNA05_00370 [Bacillus subtilis]|nr:hypothetical protein BsubNA05_00370 [Bacillus subtilis]